MRKAVCMLALGFSPAQAPAATDAQVEALLKELEALKAR